jgi:drug/metabolite transporter (DMT)-like permease
MLILLIFVMYALFAATFPIGQYALRFTSPLWLTSVRMLLAGLLLLSAQGLYYGFPRVARRAWWHILVLSFFYIYLAFVPEMWAQQYLTPLTVNIMYSTTPLIAILFEWWLLQQQVTLLKACALLLGFFGIIPLFFWYNPTDVVLSSPYPLLPEAVLFLGIIATCYAWFLLRKLNEEGYGLLFLNGISMLLGGLLSALHFFILTGWNPSALCLTSSCMSCILALIIISNCITYPLYGFLLRFYSVSFLAFAGFLSPLFGALYAWALGLETLSWHHILAAFSITIGLSLLYHEERSTFNKKNVH